MSSEVSRNLSATVSPAFKVGISKQFIRSVRGLRTAPVPRNSPELSRNGWMRAFAGSM